MTLQHLWHMETRKGPDTAGGVLYLAVQGALQCEHRRAGACAMPSLRIMLFVVRTAQLRSLLAVCWSVSGMQPARFRPLPTPALNKMG